MSIFQQYADKPWMRPTMYTSDADPSHYAGGQPSTGINRTSELVNGQAVQTGGREHYQPNEFGDGRPTGQPDRTPMVYRGPDPGAVIDIDDKDELDTAPAEYTPSPRVQPQPPPMTVEQFANLPYRHPGAPNLLGGIPPAQAQVAQQAIARGVREREPQAGAAIAQHAQHSHLASGHATERIGFDLLGLIPRHSGLGGIVAHIVASAPAFTASADELEHAAAMFQAWAKVLRVSQR